MSSGRSWLILVARGVLILLATGLLALGVLQRVITDPGTCQLTVEAFAQQPWSTTLAQVTLSSITEEQWSPFIPRDIDYLSRVYAKAIDPVVLRDPMCSLGTAVTRYFLGMEAGDTVRNVTANFIARFDDAWSERTRATFWQTLPECTPTSSAACIPDDPGLRNEYALQHSAWWDDYVPKLRIWLGNTIIEQVNTLYPFQPWIMQYYVLDVLPMILLLLAIPWRLRTRTVPDEHAPNEIYDSRSDQRTYGLPFIVTGLLLGTLAFISMQSLMVPDITVTNPALQPIIEQAWSVLWSTLCKQFGVRTLPLGALLFTIGLVISALTMQHSWMRWGFIGSALTLAIITLLLKPQTIPLVPITPVTSQATPTALPSLTPTPTATPTPVPPYWPVSSGTPIPTPVANLNSGRSIELLGCVAGMPNEPVQHLLVQDSGFKLYQIGKVTRFGLNTLTQISQRDNAHPFEGTIAFLSRNRVALASDNNLWVYYMDNWYPAMPSRFAAFADITSMYSDAASNSDRIMLGLDDGFVWDVRASTGGLIAMRSISEQPITALAQCGDVLITGEATGKLRLWDWAEGTALGLWQQHEVAIKEIVCSANNTQALSLDEQGVLILWDVERMRYLNQRILESPPTSHITEQEGRLWIGTRSGEVYAIDPASMGVQPISAGIEPVTAIALHANKLLLTGYANGEVCVWGVTQSP